MGIASTGDVKDLEATRASRRRCRIGGQDIRGDVFRIIVRVYMKSISATQSMKNGLERE